MLQSALAVGVHSHAHMEVICNTIRVMCVMGFEVFACVVPVDVTAVRVYPSSVTLYDCVFTSLLTLCLCLCVCSQV